MSVSIFCKRILFLFLLSLLFVGCSKAGEKQAIDFVRNNCNVPNSFVKVNYEVNKDFGLGRLDYKAKNLLGVEIASRAYFRVLNDSVVYIDTLGIDKEVLDDFEKNAPKDFEECVKSYSKIKRILVDNTFMMKRFNNVLTDISLRRDYYDWLMFKDLSFEYNKFLREFKLAYIPASDIVKKHFSRFEKIANDKYLKVVITGNKYDGWESDLIYTDEFPVNY